MENKLIPMTYFVLQQHRIIPNQDNNTFSRVLLNYAKFLKQHLTLGMFVPVDDEGNVLEEPIENDFNLGDIHSGYFRECLNKYNEAKSKVLFEGLSKAQYKWLLNSRSSVEDLTKTTNTITPISLTETALKQIGQ